MFRLKEILNYKTQFVFLSSTFPLYIEEEFRKEFSFSALATIRGSTTRGNISYCSKQYSSLAEEEQFQEVKDYIESSSLKLGSLEDKVLIFCPTLSKVDKLGAFLNSPIYHSSLPNKEEVLQHYLTSKEGYYQVLVATTSL